MDLSKNIKYFLPLFALLIIDIVLTNLSGAAENDSRLEKFSYLKWIMMIMATALIALSTQEKKYFTWILALVFLFVESIYSIHSYLGTFFYYTFGMTTGDKGEKIMNLFAIVFLGFIFMAPALEANKRGDSIFKAHSKIFLILSALFLCCTIAISQIDFLAVYSDRIPAILGYAKLFTESLLAGYLIAIAIKQVPLKKEFY